MRANRSSSAWTSRLSQLPGYVTILVVAVLAPLLLGLDNGEESCEESCEDSTSHETGILNDEPTSRTILRVGAPQQTVTSGQTVTHTLVLESSNAGGVRSSWVSWLLPRNVNTSTITVEGLQPDSTAGGMYSWSEFPVRPEGSSGPPTVTVTFTAPQVDQPTLIDEFFTVDVHYFNHDYVYQHMSLKTDVEPAPVFSAVAPSDTDRTGRQAAATVARPVLDDYFVWSSGLSVYGRGGVLDEAGCQWAVDLLQGGSIFFGVRLPTAELERPGTDALMWPFVSRDDIEPHLRLYDNTRPQEERTVMTLGMQGNLGRAQLLETLMPSSDGQVWSALTAVSEPGVSCPDALRIPSEEWEVFSSVHLDFGGEPDACDGCTLEVYACYEGVMAPFPMKAAALALDLGLHRTSKQNVDVTCIGPSPIALYRGRPLRLSGARFSSVEPPGRVMLRYGLASADGEPDVVTLTTTSSQGLEWTLYEGTSQEPNLASPITGPWALTNFAYFWAVVDIPELGKAVAGVSANKLTLAGRQARQCTRARSCCASTRALKTARPRPPGPRGTCGSAAWPR